MQNPYQELRDENVRLTYALIRNTGTIADLKDKLAGTYASNLEYKELAKNIEKELEEADNAIALYEEGLIILRKDWETALAGAKDRFSALEEDMKTALDLLFTAASMIESREEEIAELYTDLNDAYDTINELEKNAR